MKLGNAEGTPEEISNFFAINKLNTADYLEATEDPLHWKWIFLPSILTALFAAALVLFDNYGTKINILIFLMGIGCASWTVTSVQLKFKNKYASTSVAIGFLIILLIAAGYLVPSEIMEIIKP